MGVCGVGGVCDGEAWGRVKVRSELSSAQPPIFPFFSTGPSQYLQPGTLAKTSSIKKQAIPGLGSCLRCWGWEREMLAHGLFLPAPVHNLPWIIIVYQCWKKWLQLHFTHQHKGKRKAPVECLSHPLESLNYIHHGPLFPVSSPRRGKGRAMCLLLASLARPCRPPPADHPRLILQLRRVHKELLEGPEGTDGPSFHSQLLCIQGYCWLGQVIHTSTKALWNEKE